MSDIDFFTKATPVSLARLGDGACWSSDVDPNRCFSGAAALGYAGPLDVSVFVDGDDPTDLAASRAGACFVADQHVALVPRQIIALVCDAPLEALRSAVAILFPRAALTTDTVFGRRGVDPAAIVHSDAVFERDVTVDPGAIVGPRVEIGAGTTIGANAVIGAGVRIGRGCVIDPLVSIRAALIGDRVAVRAGARIGLGGAPKLSLGRVIIQDDAEIGANAVIERGRLGDTMIGERARIGALVCIAADTLVDRGIVR